MYIPLVSSLINMQQSWNELTAVKKSHQPITDQLQKEYENCKGDFDSFNKITLISLKENQTIQSYTKVNDAYNQFATTAQSLFKDCVITAVTMGTASVLLSVFTKNGRAFFVNVSVLQTSVLLAYASKRIAACYDTAATKAKICGHIIVNNNNKKIV
jgi:hypothetical protein